jgi:CheY-like chemotaxis protein
MVTGFESVLRRAVPSTIEFDIELGTDVGAVSVDSQRFEAAILNLVVNSRDAMVDGGMLLLKTEAVDLAAGDAGALSAGRYAQLRVVDTGSGMPPEVLARAFEPFFTTKDVGRGTGLGLSQVYGFISQSGGDVQLSSEPGQGTAVVITLPLVAGDVVALTRDPDLERVLLVEDEPELLELAANLFRSIGYDVLTANNGADAARILDRESDIDILFSDVVMPRMSGVELARWAREHHPDVRIVLTSGYPALALVEENGDIGRYPFLHKPYRLSELAKVLRKV